MRGLLLALIFFSLLPFVLRRPYLGILMWFWISLMNPHKLSYGFFSTLPYDLIIALVTLPVWLISREPKRPPNDRTAILLYLLMLWVTVTSAFALTPGYSVWDKWQLSEKMFLFTAIAYALTNTRERLDQLIAVCALSIAFVGIRGGLFTIARGGTFRVYGPAGSMIGDNNDFGVALVTMLPLLIYLFQRFRQWYARAALWATIVLNFIATLFTYSRGALVALALMGSALWLRARLSHKVVFTALFAVAIAGVFEFAPPAWFDRMGSIETYRQDASAEQRLYYWRLSWAMALHRPITGAGYRWLYFPEIVNSALADSGLPALTRPRAAHSIWFEILSDHGFVGLFIYIGLFLVGLLNAQWLVRRSRGSPDLLWANNLGRALQASIVGFAAGGTFASLDMWDGYYIILVIAAAARVIVAKELAAKETSGGLVPEHVFGTSPASAIRGPRIPTTLPHPLGFDKAAPLKEIL